jgi:predicted O-methyltransferase YrrM
MGWLSYLRDNLLKARIWLRSSGATRHHLNRALWDAGYPWTRLVPEPIELVFPGVSAEAAPLLVSRPYGRLPGTSLELDELVALLTVLQVTRATRVLEVGTFDGHTALNLALNVGEEGRVVTIDLPLEGAPSSNYAGTGGPVPFRERVYEGHPAATRIRQVLGDSARIDWSALGGPFDLVFIDGDHRIEYVRSDTMNALSVLRPGGVIAWHDYEYRSVSRVLDAAAARGERLHWIRGTRLAMGVFARPPDSVLANPATL